LNIKYLTRLPFCFPASLSLSLSCLAVFVFTLVRFPWRPHLAAIAELHFLLSPAMRPDDDEALYNLGWCHERRGSVLDAAAAYSQCLAAQPSRVDARLNLAALHHRHGEETRVAIFKKVNGRS
jgi:tetratricopeptide (TPR) repeat protein